MSYETEHPYQNYDPNFNPDEVMMRLHQLQNRIASTITAVEREDGVIKEKQSQIEQTVDEISLEVFEIDSTTGTKISRIEQNAEEISSKVAQIDYNGNTIASLINQTATTIKIDASKVDITGFVTFSALSTEGQTSIHGGNIISNTISADAFFGNLFSVGNGVTASRLNLYTSDSNYHYLESTSSGYSSGDSPSGGFRVIVPNGPISLVPNSGTGVYVVGAPLVAQTGLRVSGTGQFNNEVDVAGYLNVRGVTYTNQRLYAYGGIDSLGANNFQYPLDLGSGSYGYVRYMGNVDTYLRLGSTSAHIYVNGSSKASWTSMPKVRLEPSGDGVLDGKEFGANNPASMQPVLMDFMNLNVEGEKRVPLDNKFREFVSDYNVFLSSGNVELLEKAEDYFVVTGTGKVSVIVAGIQRGKENIVGYSFEEKEDDGIKYRDFAERRIDR